MYAWMTGCLTVEGGKAVYCTTVTWAGSVTLGVYQATRQCQTCPMHMQEMQGQRGGLQWPLCFWCTPFVQRHIYYQLLAATWLFHPLHLHSVWGSTANLQRLDYWWPPKLNNLYCHAKVCQVRDLPIKIKFTQRPRNCLRAIVFLRGFRANKLSLQGRY